MGITDFLSSVAITFRNRYLELARVGLPEPKPTLTSPEKPEAAADSPSPSQPPVDEYVPSGEATAAAGQQDNEPVASSTEETDGQPEPSEGETTTPTVEKAPDGTYFYRRQSQLDYKLDLRFDLGAITHAAELLANGDSQAVEEFAAAGFGFHAAFDARGAQTVVSNVADDGSRTPVQQKTRNRAFLRSAGRFAVQNRDFALRSFFREAASVKSKLDVKVQDGYRRAVNRFALRFRMDNRFSLSFAHRFNVQTQQVAEQAPEATGKYVDVAGAVAGGGTDEMMAAFFDAVDSYLGQTESKLTETVAAFFDRAADELGFSDALTDLAKGRLTDTISSFFDRVESSVAQLENHFGVTAGADTPEIPVSTSVLTPELFDPAVTEDKAVLAVA